MGSRHNLLFSQRCSFCCVAISFLFLLASSSTSTQLRFMAEGRATPKSAGISQGTSTTATNEERKIIMRSQIGSRPPRCERRCSTCGHCEAIQVPTNPQVNNGNRTNYSSTDLSKKNLAYARGYDNSNYKPMSWKCKCGNLIFNP